MHRFTVDYSKDRPDPRVLLHRGYFTNGIPRLIPLCRLVGHRPVVDGYDATFGEREHSRWVACDRCGIRPHPQGHLDPDVWDLGQRYTGPFNPGQPMSPTVRKQLIRVGHDAGIRLPGGWPAKPTTDIGCELVIGRSHSLGADFKLGNCSSEQVLAGHIGLGRLGALYVHTEDHGRWLQRRLNPTGYESRETGISIHGGRLYWNIWAPRNEHKASDPWWMRGSIVINPAHYLWGPIKVHRETLGEKTPATVHMPDGTNHDVTLQIEQWTRGRIRGRKTVTWEVDWACAKGIPVRNHDWKGDEVFASGVATTKASVDSGQWVPEACAAIADQCMKDRVRYNYRAPAA
ncbi:hypothetical protein [Streptomyces sp. NPDC005407]|uniref:hypothetical protein n=1 Tax=Streptomyces sp. NPDC005407 TaxID=3155340 RepID=UPI0033AD0DFE